MTPVRHGFWLPPFDAAADPRFVLDLATSAEEHGWDGFFTWDHVAWHGAGRQVLDSWTVQSAIASVTERISLGSLVTPLARRRPAVLARQAATLSLLSSGRLIVGVGLGDDRFGSEYTRFGEEVHPLRRAEMTDEAPTILAGAWSGKPVVHHGEHYDVDGIAFLPRPPGHIPVWVAGSADRVGPQRRAAGQDGYFPVNLTHPDHLARARAAIEEVRGVAHGRYDYIAAVAPDQDPGPFVSAGATWCVTDLDPDTLSRADLVALVRRGPPS